MLPDGVVINLGRIRAARDPGPAVRSAVALQLAAADVVPPGLPPSAILLIRRLADPLPGRVRGSGAIAALDPAWERAVRSRLDDLHRRATRPDGGRVAEGAEAVVFADPSELLACAAVVLAAGGLRPWWLAAAARYLAERAVSVAACFGADVRLLPAVVSRLVAWRRLEAVLSRVSVAEARDLTGRLAAAHGLPVTSAWLADVGVDGADGREAGVPPADIVFGSTTDAALPPSGQPPAPSPGMPAAGPPRRSVVEAVAPPWAPWWSPPPGMLAPVVEIMAGIAVLLHRAPPVVRRPMFVVALRRWRRETTTSPPVPAVWTRSSGAASAPEAPAAAEPPVNAAQPADAAFTRGPTEESAGEAVATGAAPSVDTVTGSTTVLPADDPKPPATSAATLSAALTSPAVDDGGSVDDGAAEAPALWAGKGVGTRLGGLLYLINVFEQLELPGAFEASWRLASAVGGWGLLEAVGRALLTGAPVTDDPLWGVIAALDGRRPGEPPRTEGLIAADYRLPAGWLDDAPEPARRLRWAASADRFRLWSAAGFVLADAAARQGPPYRRALAEAAAFGPDDVVEASFDDAPLADTPTLPKALRPWLAAAVPYLRWRLGLAMGDGSAEAIDRLLRVPATLIVTETHVDMVAPLEAISLGARLAGLDRSPSWVAGLGRVVLFHFQ